jgi:glutamate-1-semialdehyde 2,1-aminomutase
MKLEQGIKYIIKKHHQDLAVNRIASMWTLFFKQGEVNNYSDAIQSDTSQYADFFKFMFLSGVYLAPSQFEVGFISEAHQMKEIDETLDIIDKYFFKAYHLFSK